MGGHDRKGPVSCSPQSYLRRYGHIERASLEMADMKNSLESEYESSAHDF